jgi:hypothetical protein
MFKRKHIHLFGQNDKVFFLTVALILNVTRFTPSR